MADVVQKAITKRLKCVAEKRAMFAVRITPRNKVVDWNQLCCAYAAAAFLLRSCLSNLSTFFRYRYFISCRIGASPVVVAGAQQLQRAHNRRDFSSRAIRFESERKLSRWLFDSGVCAVLLEFDSSTTTCADVILVSGTRSLSSLVFLSSGSQWFIRLPNLAAVLQNQCLSELKRKNWL
ncbi:hypothetical protein OUZ56_020581 [Daphnia magna]|uniref:Uncharacterized protein n=1 Tax=Daphnia magna TaxID=35525 RepID=A0ABQ9ZF37_9CRUS|nr:hypothetical protein OUZ56_020581 [Daphnia magna]